jgi:hypothetical protein
MWRHSNHQADLNKLSCVMDPSALRILRRMEGLSEHRIPFFDASSISEPVFVCAPEKPRTKEDGLHESSSATF